jgi:Ala-tRNA(Pro) deacylase
MLPDRLDAFIARHGLDVHLAAHAEAAPTAEDAARILGVAVADIVKTMVLVDGTRTVAAVVPGDRRLDRRKAAAAAGLQKLRLASADEVMERTGYPAGGVAPLAFATPVTLVVDAALAADPTHTVIAGGGRIELLVRIKVGDLVRAGGAIVAPVTQD